MSKNANLGELRTPVYFMRTTSANDDEGYDINGMENIFGTGVPVYVKWVNAHGAEAFSTMQLKLKEPATLTARYSPKIDSTLTIYRGNDPKPYEVISIDNVEQRNVWLEIKVQRKVAAR